VHIVGARVVTPHGVLDPGWVQVRDGLLAALGPGAGPDAGPDGPEPAAVRLDGGWLLPGFVDLHCHGGGGAWMTGADPDAVAAAAALHLAHGTTTLVGSLVSAPPEALARDTAGLAALAADGLLAGVHLEGPWLAASHRGAHALAALRPPEPAEVERLLVAADGLLAMVTLAPELPGALPAVRRLVDAGVRVAVGHTAAGYDQTRAALDAGASMATHLFNAMPPMHHRDPGPVAALLTDGQAAVELIADGVHVHPAVLRLAAAAAAERVVLVTDAMAAAGVGDGEHRLGDIDVRVRDGVARVVDGGALAGSTLTMDAAVRLAVRTGVLDVTAAARAAATLPARLLGRSDRGSLTPGLRADLVHLDDDLAVRAVWRGGERVS
jgi:N-acetylglucosamine-6-phosphate deacetylase